MKIEFVAFDSFGVKSSCTFIETADCKITIDPGIAMETDSFPLPFKEKLKLDFFYRNRIKKFCKSSDIVIVTHYHYDHHIPKAELYKDKLLFIKDPNKNINKSQRERASYFLKLVKNKAKIEIADNKSFVFGKTKIKFSKPLWHGTLGTKLGKVIAVTVEDKKERLFFSSDVDGPYIKSYVDLIVKANPTILILDGHPTYLLGYLASFALLKKVLLNTIEIIRKTNCKLYIIDHHLLRDYRYREIYYEVYKEAKKLKKKVMTASEFLNMKPKVLEAYERYGPTRWKRWQPLTFELLDKMINKARKAGKKKVKKQRS